MAPSEPPFDDRPSEELLDLLDDGDRETRRAVARTLARRHVDIGEEYEWDEPSAALLEGLVERLGDDDPAVRTHLVTVASTGVVGDPVDDATATRVVEAMLDRTRDPDCRVRQASVRPNAYERAVAPLVADRVDDGDGTLHARVAEALTRRLDDDCDLVRKRAGQALANRVKAESTDAYDHDAGLFLGHPEPGDAVPALVDALGDPVDGIQLDIHLESPGLRSTAGDVLLALAEHRPDALRPHVEALATHLDAEHEDVRYDVADALASVVAAEPVDAPEVIDRLLDVLLEAFDGGSSRFARALEGVAVGTDHAHERAVPALVGGLGYHSERVRDAVADALVRVARSRPDAVPSAVESLAATAEDSSLPQKDKQSVVPQSDDPLFVTAKTDPLVAIADEHPSFVADRLEAIGDAIASRPGNMWVDCGDLLAAVADASPAAVEPALPTLVEALGEASHPCSFRTLTGLAVDHPSLVAPVLPDALAAAGREPPLPAAVARLVEETAPAGPALEDATVAALVETLGAPGANARLRAARALVALDRAGDDRVPEGVASLDDAYGAGELDPHSVNRADGAAEPLAVAAPGAPSFVARRMDDLGERALADDREDEALSVVEAVAEANPSAVAASRFSADDFDA